MTQAVTNVKKVLAEIRALLEEAETTERSTGVRAIEYMSAIMDVAPALLKIAETVEAYLENHADPIPLRGSQLRDEMRAALDALNPTCDGCHRKIDENTCYCGNPREGHGHSEHDFVPMGCDCFRAQ
jgi:hypothetical protein